MKKIIVFFFIGVLYFTACKKIKYGPELTESGRISQLIYVPSGHISDTAVGLDSKGDITITPLSVNIPPRYGIIFECQHGTFAIEGGKWESLWRSLKRGQRVIIKYREIITFDDELNLRTVTDLDFLGANPVIEAEANQ